MSQQQINFGAYPDDLNADAIRTAFQKVQQNFTELFNGETLTGVSFLQAGNGITQTQTTGNIRIDAKIANITVQSSTLKVGVNGNTTTSAFIDDSSDILVIDIGEDITVNSLSANSITSTTANVGNITSLQISSANLTSSKANISNINATTIFSTGTITGGRIESTETTLSPFRVASNVMVANLRSETSLTANYAFAANISNYASNSNLSAFSTYANSSAFSNNSDFANLAGDSFRAEYADLANVSYHVYGGLARQIPVQTATSTTAFIAPPTTAGTVLTWVGSSFDWVSPSSVSASATYANTAGTANYATFSGNAAYSNIANTADFVNDPIQANITQVGPLTSLEVTGNVSLSNPGNVFLTGGITGQTLSKSATGGLEWKTVSTPAGTEGDIQFLSAGQLQSAGNFLLKYDVTEQAIIMLDPYNSSSTKLGVNQITLNENDGILLDDSPFVLTNVSGNGYLTVTGNSTLANTSITNLAVSGNTSLGPVTNVTITGGTSGQFLSTNGSGLLSWASVTVPTIDGGTF